MDSEAPIMESKFMKLRLKKRYKIKNEKEKEAEEAKFQEFSTMGKTMVEQELSPNKEDSLQEFMQRGG